MNNLYIQKEIKIVDNSVFINGVSDFCTNNEDDISIFLKSAYTNYGINYSKFFKMDLLSKMGIIASELLLANLDRTDIMSDQIAVILANSSASLNTDKKYSENIENAPSPSVFVYTLPNIVIGEICIRHNIKGESMFFVQNEFDAELIYNYIRSLFTCNFVKTCITGWIEVNMNNKYKADFFLVSPQNSPKIFSNSNLKIV